MDKHQLPLNSTFRKATQSTATTHHTQQATSPREEGGKAAFGGLRGGAAAPCPAREVTLPRAAPALTWLFPRRR